MVEPMSLPPLPWRIEEVRTIGGKPFSGFVYLVDANGAKIAVLYGKPERKEALMDFIIRAADDATAEIRAPLDGEAPAIA